MSAVLSQADRRLAAGFAGELDRGSPEETAARKVRLDAARQASQMRRDSIYAARALIRKNGIRTNCELLAFLQCVHAAIEPTVDSTMQEFGGKLLELCTDYDADWNGEGEEA